MSSIVDLEYELTLLTLHLYDNPALPRNSVQIFIDTLINFVNVTFRAYMKQQFLSYKLNVSTLSQIQLIFDTFETNLEKFSTEHKRFSLY